MHTSSISLSKKSTTTTSSLPDTPHEGVGVVKSLDDDIPGLIEAVVDELGADLATDLVDILPKSKNTARIESAIETCNCVGFCVSRLLSTPLSFSSQKQQEEGQYVEQEQEQQALIEELKSELLLLMRLCAELVEDIRPYHQGSANANAIAHRLYKNACRVADLCHPYELLSLVRTSQFCHLDDITTTRLSAVYELEHILTQLFTIPTQQSLWTSFLQCIRQWWS